MSEETRNDFLLPLHYLLLDNTIGGMLGRGGTVARHEDGRATVLRHIRSLFQGGACGGLTDGQLLEQFKAGHKEVPSQPSRRWLSGTDRWSGESVAGC